jgi:hypothetical protein
MKIFRLARYREGEALNYHMIGAQDGLRYEIEAKSQDTEMAVPI